MQRLDRELSPDRPRDSPKKNGEDGEGVADNKAAAQSTLKTTEQLIHDLTLDLDNEKDREETLKNETLPGSCKSQYALKFRF